MSKLSWLVVGGVGFLLGSKAGTGPYEKFSAQVQRLKEDPRVRRRADEAKDTVARKTDEVVDKVKGNDKDDIDMSGLQGELP